MAGAIPEGLDRIKVLARDDQIMAELLKFRPVLDKLCESDPETWDSDQRASAQWLLCAMRAHITVADARLEEYREKEGR